MTTYRAGQRVRIEWPDGTAIEGDIQSDACVVRYARGHYCDTIVAERDGCTITVLSEPRPDEPQGLGAVVEDAVGGFWVRADSGGHLCWREVLPGTYSENDATRRHWEQIVVVRVLAEGWAGQ